MKYRKGVFLVVFNKDKYLLLKRVLHWTGWEFPKGGIESNESIEKAVSRELREETGLIARRIIDLKASGKFDYGRELPDRPGILGQTWHLFAVQVSTKKVRLDKREHLSYKWLNYPQAYNLLTFNIQKRCLKVVNWFLKDA